MPTTKTKPTATPKPPRILKPLLVLPPQKWEFELVNKRMRLTACQSCGRETKVGGMRLSIVLGSGRSQTTCKLCARCGSRMFKAFRRVLRIAGKFGRGKLPGPSPRAAFRELVEPFLPRSGKCKVCGKSVTIDPSGHVRNHADARVPRTTARKGPACPASGKKVSRA